VQLFTLLTTYPSSQFIKDLFSLVKANKYGGDLHHNKSSLLAVNAGSAAFQFLGLGHQFANASAYLLLQLEQGHLGGRRKYFKNNNKLFFNAFKSKKNLNGLNFQVLMDKN
jgi:hypothetical protein